MKIFQKIIATILILGLVLSLNFNLFIFNPKQAKALDGGGAWMGVIKETVLDAIGWMVSDMILKRLETKIIAWGTGRKSPANEPFAITDWVKFFRDAVALGAANYIVEFRQAEIEPRIKETLENLGFDTPAQDLLEYHEYARSTLEDDLGDNYQPFIDSGYSLQAGGDWDAWFSLMKPENNLFGQVLMAARARGTVLESYVDAEKKAADKRTAVSRGYKDETVTTKTDSEACRESCSSLSNQSCIDECGGRAASAQCVEECLTEQRRNCEDKCEMKSTGIPIASRIKNWGSTIEKSMTDALGKDMTRIISADEISELIGIFFSAVLNKAIDGMGMAFSPKKSDSATKARAESKQRYSYRRTFKREQTREDRTDLQSNILTGILKSIQQLSRSITSCDEDEMLVYRDYAKNLADILAANVEALYVGLEGVNLKPDFEVLDPSYAPYSVYGQSWGQVPAVKFPSKCRKVTDELNLGPDATCRWIRSGLEPNHSSECENCMYDHNALSCPPEPMPPFHTEITEETIEDKQNFYNACKGPYLAILNRCEDCLKRADEKCDQVDSAQKDQCILNQCDRLAQNDFIQQNTVSPPINGLDFYDKCLIEEKKEGCYTCLSEYLMPTAYCDQVKDYVARSIVKYPVVVHDKIDNINPWLGPYDEVKGDEGNACSDNDGGGDIDLALICRIMPDYKYEGEEVCKTRCDQYGMTTEQLRDITDFRPHGKDCGDDKIDVGGKNPWNAINDGVFAMRGKCCAALWHHDSEKYAICVGSGATTEEEIPEEGLFACHDGEGDTPDEGEKHYGFWANTNWNIERRNTGMIDAPLEGEAYDDCVILRSLETNPAQQKVTVYITKPYCDSYRELREDKLYWSDLGTQGEFTHELVDVHETHIGETLGYCCSEAGTCPVGQEHSGTFVAPPDWAKLCTFDIDAEVGTSSGPTGLDPITGEPYKVCCGLSGNAIKRPDSCGSGIPSDVCAGKRFYEDGLYYVAVPDEPDSLGGVAWCACEDPDAGCGDKIP